MDVKLPKLGEGADSGVVVNVFVKEGEPVTKGQPIIELENEKAVASIPSTAGGVVAKIHVKPGDKISVGQRLLSLGPQPDARRLRQCRNPKKRGSKKKLLKLRKPFQHRLPRRSRRRPFGESRGNWALICQKFVAASRAAVSSWRTFAPIFNG